MSRALSLSPPWWLDDLLRLGGFALFLAAIAATAQYSYVLFHSLVEIFRIVIVFGVATLAWNARDQIDQPFLLVAGLGYPAIGVLELLHTLTYKGMGVFPGDDANPPTQLWIAFRAFESVLMLIAASLPATWPAGRSPPATRLAAGFLGLGGALGWAVLSGRFPDCFVEGQGLTGFKIAVEYVIASVFAAALFLVWRRRARFPADIWMLVVLSMVCDVLTELAFTRYASVFGPANLVGHLLLLTSTYLLYRALLLQGILKPQLLLFRALNTENELLTRSEAELAVKVAERTAEITRANRRLKLLSTSNQTLLHGTTPEELLVRMCGAVTGVGGFRGAWIADVDPQRQGGLRLLAARPLEIEAALEAAPPPSLAPDTPIAEAMRAGRPVVFANRAPHPPLPPVPAGIALPLKDAAACLTLWTDDPGLIATEEIPTLEELAADLDFGLTSLRIKAERERGLNSLARVMEDTVRAIAGTVEMRDPYTAGHQRRVAELSGAIGRELGLPEERVHALGLAAMIHDLGKINIPSEILTRPGRLSEIEYALIKTHPAAGYEIIKDIEFPGPIADAMLQHHERVDGSGYPNGLRGEAIVLEARIIGVADLVEAMSSHRPYRPGLGIDAALTELVRKRGIAFDADIVDACLRLFYDRGFQFSRQWEEAG